MSLAKISRIENGRISATDVTIRQLTKALNLSGDESEALIARAELLTRVWVDDNSPTQDAWRQEIAEEHERNAKLIRFHNAGCLPPVLRTPAYRRAMFEGNIAYGVPTTDLKAHQYMLSEHDVVIQARRQAGLYDRSREYRFVIHEAALASRRVEAAKMVEQMQLVEDLCSLPNIGLSIIPFDRVVSTSPELDYLIIDTSYLSHDTPAGVVRIVQPDVIEAFTRHFEALCQNGLSKSDSLELVRQWQDRYELCDDREHSPTSTTFSLETDAEGDRLITVIPRG